MDQRSSSGYTSSQEFSVKSKHGSSKRMARSLVAVELHLLPHDVLRDILSRLSIRDVVRMSILSREWRQLRICHPDLVLTLYTFLETETTEFITNVNNLLRPLWSTSTTTTTTLDKFAVEFGLRRKHQYHIDRWVNFATASRAKHIALDFTEFTFFDSTCCKNMYIFPLCKFSGQNGSCVKSLNLGYVCLKLPLSFCGLTNLKKLTLNMASISGSDLQCLLLSCALLESISIERCSSFSSLRIRQELYRLQYLRVRHCKLKMIELCAPNLTKFELDEDLTEIVLIQCLKLSEATFVSNMREHSFDNYGFRFTFTDLPTALPHAHKLLLLLNVDQVCS
ncbi:F-box protein At5g03100-like [Triticum aestivum]|uniref:F-box protein At5g03100-like n=1 Tax=Triticum aestivum TaxID=4565 RepID=UPI001D026AE2|nr:F-box protein At5g03100-like [Triticum aestivum]